MTYSLLPLDVGFCPRRLGMTVLLPGNARSVRYRRQTDRIAAGPTADAVAAQLRAAGYRVRVTDGPLAFARD